MLVLHAANSFQLNHISAYGAHVASGLSRRIDSTDPGPQSIARALGGLKEGCVSALKRHAQICHFYGSLQPQVCTSYPNTGSQERVP